MDLYPSHGSTKWRKDKTMEITPKELVELLFGERQARMELDAAIKELDFSRARVRELTRELAEYKQTHPII